MPRNLEIKARVRSHREIMRRAQSLGAEYKGLLRQRDTYFEVAEGRLKLREIAGSHAELILYDRPSMKGEQGRWSSYLVIPVRSPRSVCQTLGRSFGVRCVVEKRRTLFLHENARIHCDQVAGVGDFIEFEVIETSGPEQARALLNTLRSHFDVKASAIVAGSYEDLLTKRLRRKR